MHDFVQKKGMIFSNNPPFVQDGTIIVFEADIKPIAESAY